ncbi:hypothetical protein Xen7305DRAFT_00051940 [Xenococcus sp. PCC 7305]|uniref:hypothetical protein n=1 Tax=Xenococcus sp. PCC 7305 TaxID=102125 RepID=UPI0002ABB2DC|nr:hypothetical protein [Xenococcus sp. PCC 7305]ELS05450.1 hypothetical protein Xen7305DRAFT_00051940 [Xenococcus sp. PCC 7305]
MNTNYKSLSKILSRLNFLSISSTLFISIFMLLTASTDQRMVNAQQEPSMEDNLKGISTLELDIEKDEDFCSRGGSKNYYRREVLSYLQNKGIPVIPNNTQQSNPKLILNIDCYSHDNIDGVTYTLELYVTQIYNINGRKAKVIIYHDLAYGGTPSSYYPEDEQKGVVHTLDSFIEEWNSAK